MRSEQSAEPRVNPAIGQAEFRTGRGEILALDVHQHVARRIPQLVAEISILLDLRHVEAQVAALRGEPRETQAQRVGAVGGDAFGKLLARRFFDGRSSSAAA